MAANICYKGIKCKACHHYRNDEDKGYACFAKGKDFFPSEEQLKDESYELYRLRWLMEHGITLIDIESKLKQELNESNSILDSEEGYENIIDTLIEEITGDIYACKEEFLNNEFKNKQYMVELLKMHEGLWMTYLLNYSKE